MPLTGGVHGMNKLFVMILFAITIGIFSGCGGSTGGGGGGTVATPPTKAIIKISTKGTLASGTQIGGVEVSVKLPAGVSAKTLNASTTETAGEVVEASGVATNNSQVVGTYTNQTGLTSGGTVRIFLSTGTGFPVGEFATMSTDIAAGYAPVSADFNQITAIVKDLNGVDITGLTTDYSAVFK
jgi:hypothetical protein